ncbi:hypothetical protein BD626DRAFT_11805 [Schizophyllum amplum]|uniref:Uncharacterized protein n=1 Tax=Schizophyllum amplum TaxID=97359 RepID=A0A550CXB8_9AGAR|nr:hypothetical protein BD626DRAFT_11805 [Auriculariopsis ampla]
MSIGEHRPLRNGQQHQGNCPGNGQRLGESRPQQHNGGDHHRGGGPHQPSGGQGHQQYPQEANGVQLGGAQCLDGTQHTSGPLTYPPSQAVPGPAKKRTHDNFDAAGWQSSFHTAGCQYAVAIVHPGGLDKSWEAQAGLAMDGAAGTGGGAGTGEPDMGSSARARTGGSANLPHARLPSDGLAGHPYPAARRESYTAAAGLHLRGLEDGSGTNNAAGMGTGVSISADLLGVPWPGFTRASSGAGAAAIAGSGGMGSVSADGGMGSISDSGDMPTGGMENLPAGGLNLPSNTGDAFMHGGADPYPDLVLDDDIMAMWNSAPAAFDTQSWEVYLSVMTSQPMHEI